MVVGIGQLSLWYSLPELKKKDMVSRNVEVPLRFHVTKSDGQQELPSELEVVPIQSKSGAQDSQDQGDCHSSVGIGASVGNLVSIFSCYTPGMSVDYCYIAE